MPDAVQPMTDRPDLRPSIARRMARLLAAVVFVSVILGGQHSAFAARISAPMCTPDAQSMPAPLQRTPVSSAEIRGGTGCPISQGPSWEILSNQPKLPIDWYQPVTDPLWIAQKLARMAPAACVSLAGPTEPKGPNRLDFASDIFRPPRFDATSVKQ
jgi:hypothetical protein